MDGPRATMIDLGALHFVLVMRLDQGEFLGLIRTLAIIFPGVRPSQLSQEELAGALVDEFANNPRAAGLITEHLCAKVGRPSFPNLSAKEDRKAFKRFLGGLNPKELAPYLWWGHRENEAVYRASLDVLDRQMDRLDDEATSEMLDDLVERSGRLKELEPQLEASVHSQKQLERRVAELTARSDENARKLENKERDLSETRAQVKKLEEALARQKEQTLPPAQVEIFQRELTEARRAAEALRLDLARAQQKLAHQGRLPRMGLFIDVQNLLITAKELFGGGLDFRTLMQKLEDSPAGPTRLLTEAYAYLAEDPANEKQRLKRLLAELGFTVRSRPILFRADGTSKGDWDLGMAVEILDRAPKLDGLILGTGDGDFLDLVNYLKEKTPHLRIEIVCFDSPRHASERLLQAADAVLRLGAQHVLRRSIHQLPEPSKTA